MDGIIDLMKKAWTLILTGFALMMLCPLLIRGVVVVEPLLNDAGDFTVVNGNVVTQTNHVKTYLLNSDAFLVLAAGLVTVIFGLREMRRIRKTM